MGRATPDRIRQQLAEDIFGVTMTPPEARAALILHRMAPGRIVPQLRVAKHRVDLAIPASRVAIEVDGHPAHYTDEGIRRDREIDDRLEIAGWAVVRLRNNQTEEEWRELIYQALGGRCAR